MARKSVPIGILFSTEGPYATVGSEGLCGAQAAIAEINADQSLSFTLEATHGNPGGVVERYATLARDIVKQTRAEHIVGCTTSWSRKEVIPVLEKHGTLLWYPCPYEGFECNEQVVYLGSCPNQHIVPLLDYIVPRFGKNPFFVGSNYIWGWETNRIARELIERQGGTVLGERYAPLGDTDVVRMIEEIRAKRPDFVLNNLIGPSSYAFLTAYRGLIEQEPAFASRPVLSCNLSDMEVARLDSAVDGHFTVAPYFQGLPGAENIAFLQRARAVSPNLEAVSVLFVQAYAAVRLIARGLAATNGGDAAAVLGHAKAHDLASPLGPLRIDHVTNHAVLPARIARCRNGLYEIVSEGEAITPDPYLARRPEPAAPAMRHLRVIK